MVSSPVIATMKIPEVVHPPVPGESHRYYGNIHLKQLKLPSNSYNHILRGTTSFPRYSEDGSIEGDMDIHEAAAAGNFTRVKELLAPQGSGETSSAFLLANEPSPSSGLTPLHYAASRGHLEIVRWLIDDAGAIVDLEDQTGETALLKASYNGHASVVSALLQRQANVNLKDNDGWTALHNAASKGFIKIVRYFMEHTGADVDVKSHKGYTPLMNAASKGNIEIVEYFLIRCKANPLIKNNRGEAAYDVAAMSFEIYICELLEKAERDWWKGKQPFSKAGIDLPNFDQPYDIVSFHIATPVIIHENQRAATGFSSLSIRGSSKFSANNLSKNDTRGAWSLLDGKPSTKNDVQLPKFSTHHNPWGWVNEWQIDVTHPRVDSQGFQYARSFDEIDRNWSSTPSSSNGNWVRRRRWFRVMKVVEDYISGGDILQFVSESNGVDYVKRAEAIVRRAQDNGNVSESDQLGQYKEAIEILLSESKTDTDLARKQEANALAKSFMENAEHLANKINGVPVPPSPSFKDVPMTPTIPRSSPPALPYILEFPVSQSRNDTPKITNLKAPSTTSIKSFDVSSPDNDNPWNNNTVQSNDIISNSNSAESVVSPTPAYPQLGLTFTNVESSDISHFKWENDEDVNDCRRCNKKFGIWIRRHHCRRCGQVVCDKCSTARVPLPPNQVLTDPSQNGEISQSTHHRVCDLCFDTMGPSTRPRSSSFTSATIISGAASSTNHRRRLSNNSTMTECPVCNISFSKIPPAKQEEHTRKCFENNGNSVSGFKYVVYKLPQNNPLVGEECPICLEEFLIGETVTRLNCLCSYHYHCIRDWFAKGGECPIHFL